MHERLLPAEENMNIKRLKQLAAGLPDEITAVQFGAIELEIEDLLAQQRQADEAELLALQAREAELRIKLGLQRSQQLAADSVRNAPAAVTRRADGNETDADNGVAYDETDDGMSLRDETAALRARAVERRRSRGH